MTTKDTRIQVPKDFDFDFHEPLDRIREIKKQTGKYNEVTRDFLDEIKLIKDHLEYLSYNSAFLSLVLSGPKNNEWERRLNDAKDYLNSLNRFPGMKEYEKSLEDELVKLSNNLEEISTEIHLVWARGHPLEPKDIYEALHNHQNTHLFHGNIDEAWGVAPLNAKEFCMKLSNKLKEIKEVTKPKREKGMGKQLEAQEGQPSKGREAPKEPPLTLQQPNIKVQPGMPQQQGMQQQTPSQQKAV